MFVLDFYKDIIVYFSWQNIKHLILRLVEAYNREHMFLKVTFLFFNSFIQTFDINQIVKCLFNNLNYLLLWNNLYFVYSWGLGERLWSSPRFTKSNISSRYAVSNGSLHRVVCFILLNINIANFSTSNFTPF